MRRTGLVGLVAAAVLLVFGTQAGADPRQDPVGAVLEQVCGYGAGFLGTTPFAPVVGTACTPPQAVGAPTEAVAEEVMPEDVMAEDVMPAE